MLRAPFQSRIEVALVQQPLKVDRHALMGRRRVEADRREAMIFNQPEDGARAR